jgi:hypothetical protein
MTDTLGLSPDRLARLDSHLAEKYIATRRLPCTLSLIASTAKSPISKRRVLPMSNAAYRPATIRFSAFIR